MSITLILCHPIICGLAMALVTWLILDFWQDILNVPRVKWPRKAIKLIVACVNGGMSYLAEVFTENNASPRTIAVYIPIMIVLEIHLMGRMKNKWGVFAILALSSFQFITLYSVSVGISMLIEPPEFMSSRYGLVLPVTIMNLALSIMLLSLKGYKISLKGNHRDREIGEILADHKKSLMLVVYTCVNTAAVTILTMDAINILNYSLCSADLSVSICRNMIVRDSILFLSSIMMLDLQSRNAKAENQTKDMVAKNILLERDLQTQNMIQMGLEAARKELEAKNQELATGIEYEKRLRKSLRRNILFRFSCNVTKGVVDEAGAIQIDSIMNNEDGGVPAFSDIVKVFLELMVHPDYRDELTEKMSVENLATLEFNERGFNIPMQISPSGFINYVTLDDDSAKIYAYVDRDYIWTDLDCTVVRGDDGDLYAYFYIMDIDEKKQQEEVIKKAAATDALTGLENRRAFTEHLRQYLEQEDNKGGALFMFDLDHFKSVNDNLGHPKGDELLKDVAGILTGTFRSNDLVCRIGGDEFCAFAKGFTNRELIIKRAEALNEAGRKNFDLPDGGSIHVSFSIGIAVFPDDANNSVDLYTNADQALYQAKESGRDCYRTFS